MWILEKQVLGKGFSFLGYKFSDFKIKTYGVKDSNRGNGYEISHEDENCQNSKS